MAEKVKAVGVKKEAEHLYFIDGDGDVAKTKTADEEGKSRGRPEKVARSGVEKEPGWLYYLDKEGDISRVHLGGR